MRESLSHTPVLLQEVLALLAEDSGSKGFKESQWILDCTFGRGGHSLAFLKKESACRVFALDRDLQALEYAKTLNQERLKVYHKSFYEFPKLDSFQFIEPSLNQKPCFDLILMDLGPSSPQLDEAHRGFSFNKEGDLDMRMDQAQDFTAKDVLNGFEKKELIKLFQSYGEINRPFSVVNDIIKQRKKKKIKTTKEFVEIIQRHHSSVRQRHPATKWFLALRMLVNDELRGLRESLPLYLSFLNPGAFLAVISFHSLEDRIVKQCFRDFVEAKQGALYNKKVIRPNKLELENNPRSRSAKLRVFQKNI